MPLSTEATCPENSVHFSPQILSDPLIGRKNHTKNSFKNHKNLGVKGGAHRTDEVAADSTSNGSEAMLLSAIQERLGDLMLAGKPLEEATAKRIAEPIMRLPDIAL
jgi:hypothetical protein